MFEIKKSRTFTREVSFQLPVDGGFEKQTITARFKLQDAEFTESFDHSGGGAAGKGVREFLAETITSIEGVVDENKEPLPYNDELRDLVLANYAACGALHIEYMTAITKVKAGN